MSVASTAHRDSDRVPNLHAQVAHRSNTPQAPPITTKNTSNSVLTTWHIFVESEFSDQPHLPYSTSILSIQKFFDGIVLLPRVLPSFLSTSLSDDFLIQSCRRSTYGFGGWFPLKRVCYMTRDIPDPFRFEPERHIATPGKDHDAERIVADGLGSSHLFQEAPLG